MEFCEGGTLASAVRTGLLHEKDVLNGRTVVRVSMWKLLSILLDVARSLEHVHRMSLLHCDLKPDNVLITTSPDSTLGLVAKLADLGERSGRLVKMMTNDRMYIRNKSVSGTITHLAPERFATGSRLTPAVDIYAFGMLMYEAYTRQRPFPNLHPASILQTVARGDRPEFPTGTPPPYRALAEACWAQEAEQRPRASDAVQQLQDMLARTNVPSLANRPRH
ncbi:kinase-like domain-containing protein [Scenedesmus sp. NREL 46B-D3]|nr:kinase-like domain-containing protein [Scenedesmus sp. NREL 46B-D3]